MLLYKGFTDRSVSAVKWLGGKSSAEGADSNLRLLEMEVLEICLVKALSYRERNTWFYILYINAIIIPYHNKMVVDCKDESM